MKQPTAVICLSPYNGGMELDAIKTAKHLSSIASIIVIAQNGKFIDSKKDEYVGYNDIVLETLSFRSSLSFQLITKTRKIVEKYNIKNVIFFGASELKSLYFSFLGLDINLIIRHGTTKSSPKKDFFHRLIYSNVSWHIGNSKHILNNVKKIIPFGKNTQSKVIYPAFDFPQPHPTTNERLTLLHIGRIAKGKGQMKAIKACEILAHNSIDFNFLIVGDFNNEDYKKEFMAFYETLTYKKSIKLLGFSSDVASFYNKSDIFLFPSSGEGLSNAFIEALFFGLEALCYNNTSFPELLELGFEFTMVENKNELEKKLLELSKKHIKHRLNTTKAKELFSKENELKEYLEILI